MNECHAEQPAANEENQGGRGNARPQSEARSPFFVQAAVDRASSENGEDSDPGHRDGHADGDRDHHQDRRAEQVVGHAEEQYEKGAGAGDRSGDRLLTPAERRQTVR